MSVRITDIQPSRSKLPVRKQQYSPSSQSLFTSSVCGSSRSRFPNDTISAWWVSGNKTVEAGFHDACDRLNRVSALATADARPDLEGLARNIQNLHRPTLFRTEDSSVETMRVSGAHPNSDDLLAAGGLRFRRIASRP